MALDDAGLLPLPPYIFGFKPSDRSYEPYLLRLIVMASLALDALFSRKLRAALEPFGDASHTRVEGNQVLIHDSDGRLLITIAYAPVKTRARMLNKLEGADDHRDKPLPRPKWNVDTVRNGIIVEDVELMAPVHEAIGAKVGAFVRGKNLFRPDYDATQSYGYRNFLGNLRLESGLSVLQVFGGAHRRAWEALGEAWRVAGDGLADSETGQVLDALLGEGDGWWTNDNAAVGDLPLNIAAEVQLIYAPYLHKGRKLSHLPYKVVRCDEPSELSRDAGGKRAAGLERVRAAERACGEIVLAELDRLGKGRS